jgi:hypothetical protein
MSRRTPSGIHDRLGAIVPLENDIVRRQGSENDCLTKLAPQTSRNTEAVLPRMKWVTILLHRVDIANVIMIHVESWERTNTNTEQGYSGGYESDWEGPCSNLGRNTKTNCYFICHNTTLRISFTLTVYNEFIDFSGIWLHVSANETPSSGRYTLITYS